MKNKINLKKLNKLMILQIIEPSENLKESYLKKSWESLLSTKFLLEKSQYNDSIYLLKQLFNMENTEIKNAKIERKDKQYYPSFSTSKEEVSNAIKSAEKFNSEIKDFIERLTSEKVNNYQEKPSILLK